MVGIGFASTSKPLSVLIPYSDNNNAAIMADNQRLCDPHNFTAYPETKEQSAVFLMNGLQRTRNYNQHIEHRLFQDQVSYQQIESFLNSKIKHYEDWYKRKLNQLVSHDNKSRQIVIHRSETLVNQSIFLDAKLVEIKKELKGKKFRNHEAIRAKIKDNMNLMDAIDEISLEIQHWEQMIAAKGNTDHHENNNNFDSDLSLAFKEQLRAKSENEKILNDLINELEIIRTRKQ